MKLRIPAGAIWLSFLACCGAVALAFGWGLTSGTAAADEIDLEPDFRSSLTFRTRPGLLGLPDRTITEDRLGGLRFLVLYRNDLPWAYLDRCDALNRLFVLGDLIRTGPRLAEGFKTVELGTLAYVNFDASQLERMHGLEELRLSHLQVPSFQPIARLDRLEELRVAGCTGPDVEAVAECTSLRTLVVSERRGRMIGREYRYVEVVPPDSSLASIVSAQLPVSLESLAVAGIPLPDLEYIGRLENLKILDIGGTGTRSIAPLAGLDKLWRLYLDGNVIDDLEVLYDLPALREVWVSPSGDPADAAVARQLMKRGVRIQVVPTTNPVAEVQR